MQTILTTESLRVSFFFFIIIYRTDCYEFPYTWWELLSLLEFRVRISSAHCDQKTVDLIKTVVEGLLAKFRELTMVFVNVIIFLQEMEAFLSTGVASSQQKESKIEELKGVTWTMKFYCINCYILYYISLINFALLIWPSDIYMYRCIEVHNYSTMYFYTSHLPRLTLYLQLYMIISASSPALYNVQVSFILLQMIYFVLFCLSLSKTTKNKLKRNRWAVR